MSCIMSNPANRGDGNSMVCGTQHITVNSDNCVMTHYEVVVVRKVGTASEYIRYIQDSCVFTKPPVEDYDFQQLYTSISICCAFIWLIGTILESLQPKQDDDSSQPPSNPDPRTPDTRGHEPTESEPTVRNTKARTRFKPGLWKSKTWIHTPTPVSTPKKKR
jgi:hypothetical protein